MRRALLNAGSAVLSGVVLAGAAAFAGVMACGREADVVQASGEGVPESMAARAAARWSLIARISGWQPSPDTAEIEKTGAFQRSRRTIAGG